MHARQGVVGAQYRVDHKSLDAIGWLAGTFCCRTYEAQSTDGV